MAKRLKQLIALQGEQKRASDPRELVWLSASAGTGKTHVLSSRVLRLLLSGIDPSSILCLTFTKAGAAEMADRIHERMARWVRAKHAQVAGDLQALGEPFGPEAVAFARTLFARVLDAPGGGLRIQTIHSFCQTLLGSFPIEAGLTPGFRPLEDREAGVLARRALSELLTEAEAGGRLGLIDDVQRLSRRLGEAGAEAYLLSCARVPDAMIALGADAGIEPRLRRAFDVPLDDVEQHITAQCDDAAFDCAAVQAISSANAAWGTATGLAAADRCVAFLAAGPAARAMALDDLADVVLTKTGDPRKPGAKLLAIAPDYAAFAERVARACTALTGMRARAALAALLAAGLRAGQAFAGRYADAKRASGVLDFDDLIRRTVALLQSEGVGEWVRYKLDQATDHILVDEAQDTNIDQWSIVAALAAEYFVGAGAKGRVHRTIFTVGDFKQAIFGFQGTDPAAFSAARQAFAARIADAADPERAMRGEPSPRLLDLSLDRSFRTTPPVLELVDRLIEDLGHGELGLETPSPRHVSHRAGQPGSVTLWRPVTVDSDGDDDEGEEGWIDDSTRRFATLLARQIRMWIDDPFPIAGKGRLLRPEDIMVLVRRRGELASLLVARLHAEGVPVAGVDRLRLTAPIAVRDLLAVLRFAVQPLDDLNLAALLVSPLFGFEQDALYTLAFGRSGSLWDRISQNPDFRMVRDGLGTILAQADFTTPYQLLEMVLSGPLAGRRKLLSRLGQEARDPIEELLNAALAFEADNLPSLQLFLDWFDRGEVDIKRDPSAPLDAVRVMTVHGAKGLQAPVVILADATGDPEGRRAASLDWAIEEDGAKVPMLVPRKEERVDGLTDALDAAKARELEEHWRLLYVAATRAEERLIIGGALNKRAAAKGQAADNSWYQRIDLAMAGLGADWDDDPHWSGARHYRGRDPVADHIRPVVTKERAAPSITVEPEWLRTAAPEEARPSRPLAPSSIGADMVADPPPSPAMLAAAERGRLLHALFERLPAITVERREEIALHWLERSAGVADSSVRAALARDACAIISDPAHADIFGPDALAEAPIAAVVDDYVVAGTVDRLLVGKDSVRVVDFKTGRRVPSGVATVPEHHLKQMAAYVAALHVVFPGRRIDAALLYTSGPRLIPLSPEILAANKPDLTG